MENLISYEEFINEELNWKTAVAGTMLGLSTLMLPGCDSGVAKLDKTEVVGKMNFKQYSLSAKYQSFDLTINGDFIVSHHSFTESHGSGKDQHTETINVTNLIVTKPTKFIWYMTKTWGGTYASEKPFPGSHLIKWSDLELVEENPTYNLYRVGNLSFFSFSPFNYIILNKGHKKGEECKFSDNKVGTYICDHINKYVYIIGVKGLAGGTFGGAGAGGSF